MKLLSVGTSWICDKFLESILETNTFEIYKCYSRNESTSIDFSSKYNALPAFGNLNEVLKDSLIDAVYLASPTFKHYDDILLCLNNNKHVISEKPMVLTISQYHELSNLAKEKNLILFEAMRTVNLPQIHIISGWIQNKKIKSVYFEFGKVSSKYQAFLDNQNPTPFLPTKVGGGALYDLGIYSLNLAVCLFGKPESANATFEMLHNDCDGESQVIMHYQNFDVTCFQSKINDYPCTSLISLENNERIVIEGCSGLQDVTFYKDDKVIHSFNSSGNDMYFEINNFYSSILNKKTYEFNDYVAKTVYEIISDIVK